MTTAASTTGPDSDAGVGVTLAPSKDLKPLELTLAPSKDLKPLELPDNIRAVDELRQGVVLTWFAVAGQDAKSKPVRILHEQYVAAGDMGCLRGYEALEGDVKETKAVCEIPLRFITDVYLGCSHPFWKQHQPALVADKTTPACAFSLTINNNPVGASTSASWHFLARTRDARDQVLIAVATLLRQKRTLLRQEDADTDAVAHAQTPLLAVSS